MHRFRPYPSRLAGFTLVELLIVILIISILAAILIVAVGGTLGRAQVENTKRGIDVLENGLEDFLSQFNTRRSPNGTTYNGYPLPSQFRGVGDLASMSGGEFLRVLLMPTDAEIERHLGPYGIDHGVLDYDTANKFLNRDDIFDEQTDRDIQKEHAFVDGWQRCFFYRFPGRNHSDEINNKNRSGANNYETGRPDIWSAGNDGESFYPHPDEDTGGRCLSEWVEIGNDPFGEPEEPGEPFNDDVGNWFNYD